MNTSVNIAGVELKNPVMTASGTFGSGMEYADMVDLNKLGAVVTKGVSDKAWEGNPTPRVAEVTGGMLNAIGLQNPGIDVFIERDIPFLKKYDTKIIVNVCGHSVEEYLNVVERLADQPIDMMEINVSCPNVKQGALQFGQDPKVLEEVTKEIIVSKPRNTNKDHKKERIIEKLPKKDWRKYKEKAFKEFLKVKGILFSNKECSTVEPNKIGTISKGKEIKQNIGIIKSIAKIALINRPVFNPINQDADGEFLY